MSRVAVVEDDDLLRETLLALLAAHGFDAVGRGDAVGLTDWVVESRADLLVLDVVLPGLDGLTACRALREAGLELPVLVLSARSDNLDKIVGLESGADDYVTKPFDAGEFLARIRALLRRSGGRRATRLAAAGLTLDLVGRRAVLEGEELRLTQKEFDLLAEFLRNAGKVLSRDLLLERVWGYDYLGDSRTVDVHVAWLRRKIERDPAAPERIVTVRGIGYRFDA